MKKFLAIILSLILSVTMLTALVGCDGGNEDKLEVSVHVPTQTPSLAILKMLYDNEQIDSNKYEITYTLENGAPAIQTAMLSGADVVIAPTNIIAALFSGEGSRYTIAAATSMGAFHIISTDLSVESLSDLKSTPKKTVYCQGAAGGANEKILRYLLEENGVDPDEDVTLTFTAAAATEMQSGENKIGLFPEPAYTAVKKTLTTAGKTFKEIDLQEEWKAATDSDSAGYPMACLAFRTDFLQDNTEFCNAFMDKVQDSVEWLSDTAAADVAEVLGEVNERGYGELDTGVAPNTLLEEGAIARLHVDFVLTNKSSIEAYLRLTTTMTTFDNDMFYLRPNAF